MAGTSTAVLRKISTKYGWIWRIICDWTADTSGIIQQNIATKLCANGQLDTNVLSGRLFQVMTIPGYLGDRVTNLPAQVATVTLLDDYGIDIAVGSLASRSATIAQQIYAAPSVFFNTEVQLNIASVGAATAQGRVIIDLEI